VRHARPTLRCSGGDLEESFAVGVGFEGIRSTLCVCHSCKTFVLVRTDAKRGEALRDPVCPTCASPVVVLYKDEAGEDLPDLDTCPGCGGTLTFTGMMGEWD